MVGAGGLGCPASQYLVAAGVGTLGLADGDRVELSNLQRQILYGPADVGRPKVEVACERLRAINPDVVLEPFAERVTAANALELVSRYDVVVDGSDNFPTRYLLNDACVLLGKPLVYGAIFRFDGQASVFDSRRGPCYRCLHAQPPGPGEAPSCSEAGVLGVLPGLVGLVQATEALKLVAGLGEPLVGRLVHYDALGLRVAEFVLPKDPDCPACGERATIRDLREAEALCTGEMETMLPETTVEELEKRRRGGEELLLVDVREPQEYAIASIEGALLVPLGALASRLDELAAWKDRPIVVHCHHGGRSARAVELLAQRGFTRVENLKGGIDAWSLAIDPSVPRY